MSDPVRFLNAFAQVFGVMTLYPDGHPSRERAVDAAFDELDGLWGGVGHPAFTFLDEVLARLMLSSVDTSEARQMRSLGIRFGAVGLEGQERTEQPAPVLSM